MRRGYIRTSVSFPRDDDVLASLEVAADAARPGSIRRTHAAGSARAHDLSGWVPAAEGALRVVGYRPADASVRPRRQGDRPWRRSWPPRAPDAAAGRLVPHRVRRRFASAGLRTSGPCRPDR